MFRNLFNNLGENISNSMNDIEENITSSMNEFGQNMDNVFNQSYSSQSQNNKQVKFKEHVLFNTDLIHQNSCSICLEDFREGEIASILPCCHIFHQECVSPWIKKKNSCPNCRIDTNKQHEFLSKKEMDKQMKNNKDNMFFGKNEIVDLTIVKRLGIKQLKHILNDFKVDYSKCLQRDELENSILNDIFYQNKSSKSIKIFLDKHNINSNDCLEKKDLLKLVACVQLVNRIYI